MKTSERRHGDGIGTAKAVLSLLHEHSAQDFEAAEKILGANRDLALLVKQLREMKEREESAEEPLTIEAFREIIRIMLLDLPWKELLLKDFPVLDLPSTFAKAIDLANIGFGRNPRTFPPAEVEAYVERIFEQIHLTASAPSEEVAVLIHMLLIGARRAKGDHLERALSVLQEVAIRALTDNHVAFPALHSLAQLRLLWADKPLSFSPHEKREHLARRLVKDLEGLPQHDITEPIAELLIAGLRMPGESAVAAVRRMNVKKDKANGDR